MGLYILYKSHYLYSSLISGFIHEESIESFQAFHNYCQLYFLPIQHLISFCSPFQSVELLLNSDKIHLTIYNFSLTSALKNNTKFSNSEFLQFSAPCVYS